MTRITTVWVNTKLHKHTHHSVWESRAPSLWRSSRRLRCRSSLRTDRSNCGRTVGCFSLRTALSKPTSSSRTQRTQVYGVLKGFKKDWRISLLLCCCCVFTSLYGFYWLWPWYVKTDKRLDFKTCPWRWRFGGNSAYQNISVRLQGRCFSPRTSFLFSCNFPIWAALNCIHINNINRSGGRSFRRWSLQTICTATRGGMKSVGYLIFVCFAFPDYRQFAFKKSICILSLCCRELTKDVKDSWKNIELLSKQVTTELQRQTINHSCSRWRFYWPCSVFDWYPCMSLSSLDLC